MTDTPAASLPEVLAGPLLRRVEPTNLALWLVASRPLDLQLTLTPGDGESRRLPLDDACRRLRVGRHAWVHLIHVTLEDALPEDVPIGYDLHIPAGDGESHGIAAWAPHLLYPGQTRPDFVLRSRCDDLLHGSCRRPHHPAADGLARADHWYAVHRDTPEARPALLMLTGDQIYADDVAGPLLAAIHALIRRLGLYGERLEGAVVGDSAELLAHPATYYHREHLLPEFESSEALRERFFGGARKPIFTTANASNHLITFAEVIAMYLLVWSPVPWRLITASKPALGTEDATTWDGEAAAIDDFVATLPQAARVMAQLPTLMIFDDHDITDDWNLTAAWEETAYGHPFSRRIIGNALLGYLLCQGWGNAPRRLEAPLDALAELLDAAVDGELPATRQDGLIRELLRFEGWDYTLPTTPRVVVLDTRTRRWRSERARHRPSGLMDWEALSDFQQTLLDEPSVIVVSPAPIFGVKLIEGVQRLFTWAGKPLLVDAENWMAHRGAASVMLNIFRHSRTPGHYMILSGDVHYSFAYEIRLRHRRRGPRIWQVTSSGLKNTFPDTLLDAFDRLNRWLYAPWSPLNLFTQRRGMHVRPLVPERARAGERLWNGAGIGHVRLDAEGRPREITQLGSDDRDTRFL
ncbi:alkaline phosphatase family protein [Modicisalibacter sp. 'Wilcox']|uniref:alkaline phosphatase family protein n=1 Tax=Modicisalibacter sp. 'Wilcox' TaxID=2679914 RepID=UPI0013D3C3FF|nr:alkaline phosphatase family protein [Modicisalibacter sp. 'Wilcox']